MAPQPQKSSKAAAPTLHSVSIASSPVADHLCQVVEHRTVGDNLKILRLKTTTAPFACGPGEFVMVDLNDPRFFFRRPFSVLDIPAPDVLDIYYKIVGQGTEMMADWKAGEHVKILGPLGNRFTLPKHPEHALLVGGGIGIAPLYLLGKTLKDAGQPVPYCFYGVRGQAEIGLLEPLTEVFGKDRLFISTDDGSDGQAGNVCDLLKQHGELVQAAQEAFVCGPTPMMRAAYQLLSTAQPGMYIEASLEEHMPCGTGACTGCVVPRTDRLLPSKVCFEGPVFDAKTIDWAFDFARLQTEANACLL